MFSAVKCPSIVYAKTESQFKLKHVLWGWVFDTLLYTVVKASDKYQPILTTKGLT